MRFVLDADAVIKLHRAAVLRDVIAHVTCVVPGAVFDEAVTKGKQRLFEDAEQIEKLLSTENVETVQVGATESAIQLGPGETEVLMFASMENDAVAVSDDRQFLSALTRHGIAFLTPAAVLVFLANRGILTHERALQALERMRPSIRAIAYQQAKNALQQGGDDED